MEMVGKEPDKELLRRRDVIDWLGLTVYQFEYEFKKGTFNPIYLGPNSLAYYKKSDIKQLITSEVRESQVT